MQSRGFTLIELLVVIAIIGILSSVVLANLNTARAKSRDASVLANMDSLSAQGVLYQDTNGSFGDTAGASDCTVGVFSDEVFQNVFTTYDTTINPGGEKACYAADSAYAVALARVSGDGYTAPTVYWCADNTGKKCGIDDLTPLTGATCNCP